MLSLHLTLLPAWLMHGAAGVPSVALAGVAAGAATAGAAGVAVAEEAGGVEVEGVEGVEEVAVVGEVVGAVIVAMPAATATAATAALVKGTVAVIVPVLAHRPRVVGLCSPGSVAHPWPPALSLHGCCYNCSYSCRHTPHARSRGNPQATSRSQLCAVRIHRLATGCCGDGGGGGGAGTSPSARRCPH